MASNTAMPSDSGMLLGDSELLKLNLPGSDWTGEKALEYWGKRYDGGQKALVQSFYNDDLIYDQSKTFEQKLAEVKAGFEAQTQPGDDYKNAPFYVDAVGAALESVVPGLWEAGKEGLAVGAAGGAATALAGGSPMIGFALGMPLGMAENFRRQMRGAGYGDLLMAGLSEEHAKTGAEIIGLGGAGLEMMGATAAAGAAKAVFGATLRKTVQAQAVKNLVPLAKRIETNTYVNLFAKGVQAVGIETAEEGAQQVLSDLTRIGYLLKEKGLVSEDNPDGVELGSEYQGLKTNASKAMIEAFKASLVLGVVGGGASYGAGKSLGSLQAMSSDPKVVAAINKAMDSEGAAFVKRAIRNMADTLEDIRYKYETGDVDPGQIDLEDGKLIVRVEQEGSGIQELSAAEEIATPLPEGADVLGTEPQAMSVADAIQETIKAATGGQGSVFEFDEKQKEALDSLFTDQTEAPAKPAKQTVAKELAPIEEFDMQPLSDLEVEARAKENTSTLRVLRMKERQLVRDIETATMKGRAVAKNVEVLDEVRNKIEFYEHENEILEIGAAVREDMRTYADSESKTGRSDTVKYGRLTMRQFAQVADKIAKQAQRLEDQRNKFDAKLSAVDLAATERGKTLGRRAVGQAQKQLNSFINAMTPNRAIRRELKSLVSGAHTVEALTKLGPKIEERFTSLITKMEQKEFKATRNKLLGRIEGLLAKGFPSTKKGYPTIEKVDADTADALRAFAGVLRNPEFAQEAREAFLEEFGEKMERGALDEIPTKKLVQFRMTELAALVNESNDLLTLNVAEGTLRNMVEMAKEEIEAKKAERRQATEELKALADEAFGVDEWRGAAKDRSSTSLPNEKRAKWLETLKNQTLTFDSLLASLMQENEAAAQLLERLDEFASREEYLTRSKYISDAAMQRINPVLKQAGINTTDYLISLNEETYQINFMNPEQNMRYVNLTKGEILDVWMKLQAKQPIIRETMQDMEKGNGWSTYDTPGVKPGESLEGAIEQLLSDTDKKVGMAILDFYSKEYYYDNTRWYRERYNVDLPYTENYSPLKRNVVKVGSFDTDQLHYASYLPPSMKSRVKSLQRLRPQNPFQTLREHISSWEYAKAYGSLLDDLGIVFRRSDVADYITTVYGKGTTEVIGRFIDRFLLNDAMPSSDTDAFWTALRADMTSAYLSFGGVPQALTQATSGFLLWKDFSPVELFRGVVDYATKAKKTENKLRQSATLNDRWEGGSSLDMDLLRSYSGMWFNTISKLAGEQVIKPNAKLNAFQKAAFMALRFGEAAVVRVFGGPLYHAALRRGMNENEALLHVARATEKTQQSRTVSQIPDLYASSQLTYMFFGMFGLQPAQLWSMWSTAQTKWNNRTPVQKVKTLPGLFGAAMMFWWMPNLLYSLIPALPALLPGGDEDDEQRRKDAAVQMAATTFNPNTPVLGRVLEAIWFEAAKEYLGSDMPSFSRTDPFTKTLYENPKQVYTDWKSWMDKAHPDDIGEIFDLAFDFEKQQELEDKKTKAILRTINAVAPLTGIPRKPPSTAVFTPGLIERGDYVGAALSVAGWSSGSLSPRVGDKAEDPLEAFFDSFGEVQEQSMFDQHVEAVQKTAESFIKNDEGGIQEDLDMSEYEQGYEQQSERIKELEFQLEMDMLDTLEAE